MITTSRQKIQKDLANLLKCIAYWEIHIENYKLGMAENPLMDIYECFYCIDVMRRGSFDKNKLHQFLSSNQCNASHLEMEQLIETVFQADYVDQEKFTHFILPKTSEVLKQMQLNKQQQGLPMNKQFAVHSITTLFERLIEAQRQINKIRAVIHQQKEFDVHYLWKVISERNSPIEMDLTETCVIEYIKNNNSTFSKQEFKALLWYNNSSSDKLSQFDFNKLVMIPTVVVSTNFNSEINKRIDQKYRELGIKRENIQPAARSDQHINFRQVFDPVREGRPEFKVDGKYLEQLCDYKQKYIAPSRNYELQYRVDPHQLKDHDYFFQGYYSYLQQQDQDQIYFNRFGKRYVYQ